MKEKRDRRRSTIRDAQNLPLKHASTIVRSEKTADGKRKSMHPIEIMIEDADREENEDARTERIETLMANKDQDLLRVTGDSDANSLSSMA